MSVFLALFMLAGATDTYILLPMDDAHLENSSYGSKGNILQRYNLTPVLNDYNDKNMTFISAVNSLYAYDLEKNWNNVKLYSKDPADTCWNETMTCADYEACKGTRSTNELSQQSLVKNDHKYYSWNATGTLDATRPGVLWHLEQNHTNISFLTPFHASEYGCQVLNNSNTLWAEDNSGKGASMWSKEGTHSPLLIITLQDPKELLRKIRLTDAETYLKFSSKNIYLKLTGET